MPDFESIWSPAKVFSPSAAKSASQQQKDWAYVDQFLTSRFAPNPIPPFERNSDTLKALLALAAANESADEEKLLERRVKEKALRELQALEKATLEKRAANGTRQEPLLSAVEEQLTDEGRRCLNSVALLSVALASTSTDPQRYDRLPVCAVNHAEQQRRLATHLIDLTRQEHLVQQQTSRLDTLHARLQTTFDELRAQLLQLQTGEEHKLPADVIPRTTDWNKTSRHLRNKAEDYKGRLEAMDVDMRVTVPELVAQEEEVLALKALVLDLETRAKGFQGLPPEKDLARVEVERVQAELEDLEAERDRLYDRMVGK